MFYSCSNSGVSKLHLWAKPSPLLVFANKVLFAHSHGHLLDIVYGCISATTTEGVVVTETMWLAKPKIFSICLLQKKSCQLCFSQWNIMQPTPEKKKKTTKPTCEVSVATWKYIYSIKKWDEGNFQWKKSPLMSLKYLHCKEGGRQMLRSLVTMVIFPAASLGLLPSVLQLRQGSGLGVGQWFQIPREGPAGKPACRAHKPNICCTKIWKSLAHKYVPCWGRSWAEQPDAVSFHLRGRPQWAGCCGEGAG